MTYPPAQVWKFPLEITTSQKVSIPKGSQILTVQIQGNTPCLWALVLPYKEKEDRIIEIYGTGHDMESTVPREYIGTFQVKYPALVFHVFENKKEKDLWEEA